MEGMAGLITTAFSDSKQPSIQGSSGMFSTQSCRRLLSSASARPEVVFVHCARSAITMRPNVRLPNSNHRLSGLPPPHPGSLGAAWAGYVPLGMKGRVYTLGPVLSATSVPNAFKAPIVQKIVALHQDPDQAHPVEPGNHRARLDQICR